MDSLEPWVDVAAVRRMAEQLLTVSPLPSVDVAPDTGFGSDFVGFAPTVPPTLPPATQPSPVALEDRAVPVAAETQVSQSAPASPVAHSVLPEQATPVTIERRGPLLDRLGRFREGLIRYTGAQGVFVLDREGKPVMDDPSCGKLYFLARSLAQAYRPVAGQAGNVHVKIGANLILEVIPVETPFGCLVLGAVLPQSLAAEVVGEIAVALKRAATPGDSGIPS